MGVKRLCCWYISINKKQKTEQTYLRPIITKSNKNLTANLNRSHLFSIHKRIYQTKTNFYSDHYYTWFRTFLVCWSHFFRFQYIQNACMSYLIFMNETEKNKWKWTVFINKWSFLVLQRLQYSIISLHFICIIFRYSSTRGIEYDAQVMILITVILILRLPEIIAPSCNVSRIFLFTLVVNGS